MTRDILTNRRKFNRSAELHERALRTIPGATQTFSKSTLNLVEGASPLFFEKGKGATVWDYDGNEYIDFVLGLLPVILGYCDPDVDAAIRAQLEKGISFSLATDLEAELAERLVRLIPCAEMVRFGKNGTDATSAAVRLARAYTGRDMVAVCGYHGWQDWYIGSTSRDLGVPESVKVLTQKFPYNDATALEALLEASPNKFAAIILEPAGVVPPAPGFLSTVRSLANQHGAVLVFDEIISGFRIDMGGAQSVHDVMPDLATFGKAMANGMPISAIVGRKDIMLLMNEIFFSGTFGGEALSLAAAIATIDKLAKEDVPTKLASTGAMFRKSVNSEFTKRGLGKYFSIQGDDWWPLVSVSGDGDLTAPFLSSILRQELIENGVFIGGTLNMCFAHCDPAVIERCLEAWRTSLDTLTEYLSSSSPEDLLLGKELQPIFQVRT